MCFAFRSSILFVILLFTCTLVYAQDWQKLNDPPIYKHHSNGFGFNGKGYIFEGVGQGDTPQGESKEVWEYTPESDTWVRLPDFPGDGRGFAIGDDMDGKYYYGFGVSNAGRLNDLWVFDPMDTSYTQLPSCPCEGRYHPAFIAHNNKIFMGSGSGENSDLKDWWVFDIATMSWEEKDDIPGADRHHPFQFAVDSFVYVGGGHENNWEKWNINTETWTSINNQPDARVAGSQFSYEGKGYVLGGDYTWHTNINDDEFFMEYDPLTDTWENLSTPPSGGGLWANSSMIIGDNLYLFGGRNDVITDNSLWVLDLVTFFNPSSTINEETEQDLTLLENPISDELQFVTKNTSVTDYNIQVLSQSGSVLYTKQNHNLNDAISFKNMVSGIYLVEVQKGPYRKQFRVVKM